MIYQAMKDVTVRPVQIDDETDAKARPTRTSAYALREGEPIEVRVGGVWKDCLIVGSAHSVLRVVLSSRPPQQKGS